MATELVGTTIAQYELETIIGEGSQATVYKAYQPNLDRYVAIKILKATYHQTTLARFKREATTIAQLRHRNIMVIHAYGEYDGYSYIVMEYVSGGTLSDYLQDEPMSWVKAINLILPIANALHYAHQKNLIHRDVKPSNILMPQPDWPLLADFGLVKITTIGKPSITDKGVIVGSPAYAPPEQIGSKPLDGRADIYTLGIILFQLVTGRLPFEHQNSRLMMLAHLKQPIPKPAKFNPKCPPQLEEIIFKATAKEPDDRYPDMQMMEKALQTVIKEATQPFTAADMAKYKSQAKHSFKPTTIPKLRFFEKDITFDLPQSKNSPLIIGRVQHNNHVDINLVPHGAKEAGISRKHACLIEQENRWWIDDLDSTNNTYINNVRVVPGSPVALKNGDIIRCGQLSFVFLLSPSL